MKLSRLMFMLLLAVSPVQTASAGLGDLHILSSAPAVRVGETLELSLEIEGLLGDSPADPGSTCTWTASAGSIAGDGPEVTYTPPSEPGYIALTVTCQEGEEDPVLTAKRALLVYKQFVIIKADDLLSYDGTVSDAWQIYLDYMSERRRIKHSAGIITESLAFYTLSGANDYTGLIRAHHDAGLAEFWHHGLDHSGSPVEARLLDPPPQWRAPLSSAPLTEFFGQPYAYQKSHLEDGLAYAEAVLGFPMHTFGAPFGLTDGVTTTVVDESDDIKVWFDGQPASTKRVIDVNELLVENPTGYPILGQFEAVYDPEEPLIVLQVHPGYTEDPGAVTPFIVRFNAWSAILDQLEAEDVTFLLPFEYHQLFEDGAYPLHPDADSDGDGIHDRDEGSGDDNADGLPDFLDPLSDGTSEPRVRNVTTHPDGTGIYEIAFDFLGTGFVPRDFTVELEESNGTRTELQDFTVEGGGNLSGLPGTSYEIAWDALTQLGEVELDDAALVVTPAYNPLPIHDLLTVPGGEFTQGCPACDTGDSQPRFDVNLDGYYLGKYEVTNAEFATVLNGVYLTGSLGDANAGPYSGGDVYLAGQLILNLDDPDCAIDFNAGIFSVKTREAQSLANHPVTHVTWYGAVLYCHALSILEGLLPAYELGGSWALKYPYTGGYRLPTEAEWERAAAWGGGEPAFNFGIAANTIDTTRANYDNANPVAFTGDPYTAPVGYYNGDNSTIDSPSTTGAYDMSGNVAEWVHDRYAPYAAQDAPLDNPRGIDTRAKRVIRGGDWSSAESGVEAARRTAAFANRADGKTGFRIARATTVGIGRSAAFRVDTIRPEASIALVGNPDEDAATVTYQAAFTEPVQGVTEEFFSLETTGSVEIAPSISGFSFDGEVCTITADTGFMQGNLTLKLADATGEITDTSSNPLVETEYESTPFALNTIQPAVTAITLIGNPALNASSVQYLVQFNKPVTGVTFDDFSVLESGRVGELPTVTGVELAGAACTVTVALGLTEGSYGLRLDDADASILGAGDFPLRDNTVDSALLHTADTRGALASASVDDVPAANAQSLTVNLQFSEPVTGLGLANFTLDTTGTVTEAPGLEDLDGSGDSYQLTIDTGVMDGVITLAWVGTGGILDAAGNPLFEDGGALPLPAVDTIPPVLLELLDPVDTPPNSRNVAFLLNFSEPVYDFAASEFTPVASGTVESPASILQVERRDDLDTLEVSVDPGTFTGALFLQFLPQTLRDAAGNLIAEGAVSATGHSTDTVPPRLSASEAVTPSPTNGASIQYRLTFTEPVSGLVGEGGGGLLIDAGALNYDAVQSEFDGSLSVILVTLSGLSTASAEVALNALANGVIRDQNDNPLDTVSIEAARITVDRTPPDTQCRARFVDLDGAGIATLVPSAFDDGSTDDSGSVTATLVEPASVDCDSIGLNSITVTFADALGNTATCSALAVVRDPLDACRPPEGEGQGEALADGEGEGEGGEGEGQGEAAVEGEGTLEGEGEGEPREHSADWNGTPDGRFDLAELLRAIQLYNAAGVCCDETQTSDDGYLPGACASRACARHTGDFAEPAWELTLSEILRMIQLFNLGAFVECPEGESEDGFCPSGR